MSREPTGKFSPAVVLLGDAGGGVAAAACMFIWRSEPWA